MPEVQKCSVRVISADSDEEDDDGSDHGDPGDN